MVAVQIIASLMADVGLVDVTRAFLESDELHRAYGKVFLQQPRTGLPGVLPRQLLEVVLPLYGLNDSLKRWFLHVTSVLKQLGWEPMALDECVFFRS